MQNVGRAKTRRARQGIRVNYDSVAAVTAFPRDFAEDGVSNGAQYKSETGELTTDCGGARILRRERGGQLHRISGCLVDVHKTLVSASKCAGLGRDGWLIKGGGYSIPDHSALSHTIKQMIDKDVGKPRNNVIIVRGGTVSKTSTSRCRWQDQCARARLIRGATLEHS